jgi:broad specificity phosphatase PhoE
MLHLTFLRHAESGFNADPLDTRIDCPLTDRGQEQARAAAKQFQNITPFDHIVMSPLMRARQTLELLTLDDASIPVHVWPCVREQRQDVCDFMEGEDRNMRESERLLAYRTDVFWHQIHDLARDSLMQDRHVSVLVVSHNEWIAAATGTTLENACIHTIDMPWRTLSAFEEPSQWFVLDLDGVLLTNLRPELLPGAKTGVHKLASIGPVFLCSYNHRGRDILWQTQLLPYFDEVLCGQTGPKADQIKSLAARHGLPLSRCVFFDDTPAIVDSCNAASICSVLQGGEDSSSARLALPLL